MWCSPAGMGCSSVGSFLHSTTGPARSLSQDRLHVGPQPPPGIHMLQCGLFQGLQVDVSPPWMSMGCRATAASHHRLQGSLSSGSSFPPSFASVPAKLFLSHILTPLFSVCNFLPFFFFFLKYVTLEALPLLRMGLASASSRLVLEPAAFGSFGHRKLQAASHSSQPCSPLPTKTLPCKPSALCLGKQHCKRERWRVQLSLCRFCGFFI